MFALPGIVCESQMELLAGFPTQGTYWVKGQGQLRQRRQRGQRGQWGHDTEVGG